MRRMLPFVVLLAGCNALFGNEERIAIQDGGVNPSRDPAQGATTGRGPTAGRPPSAVAGRDSSLAAGSGGGGSGAAGAAAVGIEGAAGMSPAADPGAAGAAVDRGMAGASAPPPATFRVERTMPSNETTLDDVRAVLQLELSADVDASTVTPEHARVLRDGTLVRGDFDVQANIVRFKAETPWALAAEYTVEVGAGVRSREGEALEPFGFRFMTREGRWETEGRGDAVFGVDVAMSGSGRAAVIWNWLDQAQHVARLERFEPDEGWSHTELFRTDPGAGPSTLRVAINDLGQAAASWRYSDRATGRSYPGEGEWSPEFAIRGIESAMESSVYDLRISADGHVYGSLIQFSAAAPVDRDVVDGFSFHVGDPRPVAYGASAPGLYGVEGRLVMLDERPLLFWREGNPESTLWAMHGVKGMRMQLSESNVRSAAPAVAAAGDHAIAVWMQSYGPSTNILSSRYTVSGAWSAPHRVSDAMSAASAPSVAIDARGRALAAWEQVVGDGAAVFAATYVPEKGWSAPHQLSSTVPAGSSPIAILEPGGHGFVFWVDARSEPEGTYVNAHGKRYLAGADWTEFIGFYEGDDTLGSGLGGFDAAIDHSGRVVVAWLDDTLHIARFD